MFGDVFWAWGFTLFTAVGLGVTGIALVGAVIAGFWASLGLYLGKTSEKQDNHF